MPDLKSVDCPSCGAALPARDGVVECEYCHRQVRIGGTREHPIAEPAAPLVPSPERAAVLEQLERAREAHHRSRRRRNTIVPVVVVTFFAVLGTVGYFMRKRQQSWKHAANWSSTTGVPVIADLDGQGVEDFAGFTHTHAGKRQVWFDAYAGDGGKRLWRAGPFGSWEQQAYDAQAVLVGRRIVITDVLRVVSVLDASSGKVVATGQLSDSAEELCLSPDGNLVFAVTKDEVNANIDPTTAAVTPGGPRPAWCPDRNHGVTDCRLQGAACRDGGPDLEAERMDTDWMIVTGERALVVGTRRPGTTRPMIAGLAGSQVLWARDVMAEAPPGARQDSPAMATALGQRGYVYYAAAGRDYRVQAVDLADGKQLWDVPVPNPELSISDDDMRATATRVYLVHQNRLDVLDAQTGKPLLKVGKN